jgi:predicted CxxxxCH...CXXCH cytochrome family protein
MRTLALLAFAALVAAPAIGGCSQTSLGDGLPPEFNCSSCHGNADNSCTGPTACAAPPRALNGETSTRYVGVGAHQVHMQAEGRAGRVSGSVLCRDCHVVPKSLLADSHPDLNNTPALVVFGDSAKHTTLTPVWDHDTARCANVYCHGATLRGANARPGPIWTRVDGSQVRCDSCHGNPPGGTHSQSRSCDVCHADVGPDGAIIDQSMHINGVIDVVP